MANFEDFLSNFPYLPVILPLLTKIAVRGHQQIKEIVTHGLVTFLNILFPFQFSYEKGELELCLMESRFEPRMLFQDMSKIFFHRKEPLGKRIACEKYEK